MNKIKNQAQAPLPTKHGTFHVQAYALDSDEQMPHMVLINPETDFSKIVNVRVHSECMTGDVFGSYKMRMWRAIRGISRICK